VAHVEDAVARSFWRSSATANADTNAGADAGPTSFLVETSFERVPALTTEYGAPAAVWTRIDISPASTSTGAAAGASISVTVTLVNKTATRHAEALFLRLNPAGVSSLEMDKIGSWIKMEEGLVVDGGNKHMHGVQRGVRFNTSSAGASMVLETLDAGIVSFGVPTGFPILGPYGNGEPDLSAGASSMMLNNLWG
jgi:hypothetical protein